MSDEWEQVSGSSSFIIHHFLDRLPRRRYDEEERFSDGRDFRRAESDRKAMNPIWTHLVYDAARRAMRVCTHCKRAAEYALKRPGQFYKCKHCGHRFKEKGK